MYDNTELYKFILKYWEFLSLLGLITNAFMSYMIIKMYDMSIWTLSYASMRLVWAISCTTTVFGLMGLTQRFFNKTNKVLKYLSARSFAVYYIHMTVVIAVGYYVLTYVKCVIPLQIGMIIGISVVVTLVLVEIARKIPGINVLLGMNR